MKNYLFLLSSLILLLISSCKGDEVDPEGTEIEIPEGYSLVWSDEFDDLAVNTANWNYDLGDGTDYGLPAGWGNNEKQLYTNSTDNAKIEDLDGASVLAITAMENAGAFSSAKLTTKNIFGVRFGRIEVKAKMPQGQGLLPAIWMLGDNIDDIDWPGCGEVDIVEVLGHETATSYSTLHYTNSENKHDEDQNAYNLSVGNFSDTFHNFTMEWTPEYLSFSIDAQEVYEVAIADDMKEFLRSFYLIMNVAVGGNWPGEPDASTVFPQTMYVDYIRVFSKDGFVAPEAPVLDIEEETVGQLLEPNIGDNAIQDGFDLGNLSVIVYGPGAPEITTSTLAVDGDLSLAFNFPGGDWGGAYIELEDVKDASSYTNLKFSLNKPSTLTNAEIKLESPSTNSAVFLKDYTGVDVGSEFMEYTIPLADFTGLDLTQIKIPFSMWNPQDAANAFVTANVLIDNLYFAY